MSEPAFDVNARVQRASEGVKKLAGDLHAMMVEMASELAPFPYFLGSTEVRAVEAEPGGVQKADRGCIVVCPDGEMYEFVMKIQAPGGFDLGMVRDDSVKPVELLPEDYIPYAYHAIKELAVLIDEQRQRAKKYSY